MGKELYGHKQPRGRRRPDVATEEESHWLTLVPATSAAAEAKRHTAIVGVLRAVLGDSLAAGLEDSLASGLVGYASDASADSADSWTRLIFDACEDAGVPLRADADAEHADEEEAGPSSTDLMCELKRRGVLCATPPPLPPPKAGDPVLAVLEEDGEWHAALIVSAGAADPDGSGSSAALSASHVVRFLEWGKEQRCRRTEVIPLASVVADDGDGDDGGSSAAGACELCRRTSLPLTFHHLIPKEVHHRYANKPLPRDCPAQQALGADAGPGATANRHWLSHYGAVLCRPCHSVVHALAPNAVLATTFSSIDALREAPSVVKWVNYAGAARR